MRRVIIAILSVSATLVVAALTWTTVSRETSLEENGYWISYPSPAFSPRYDWQQYINGERLVSNAGSQYWHAPIILPPGTTIERLRLICLDNNPSGNIWLSIIRVNDEARWGTVCSVASSGARIGWRTFTRTVRPRQTSAIIDNKNYSYYFTLFLPGTNADQYRFTQAKLYIVQ